MSCSGTHTLLLLYILVPHRESDLLKRTKTSMRRVSELRLAQYRNRHLQKCTEANEKKWPLILLARHNHHPGITLRLRKTPNQCEWMELRMPLEVMLRSQPDPDLS